jgi:FAD/FMN-containing dehydrogenase
VTWTQQPHRLAWGRIGAGPHRVARPRFSDQLQDLIGQGSADPNGLIVVGAGRSYDISALNPGGSLIDATSLDNLIAFDPATGILRAEAGVTLDQILAVTVPRGWFTATTPGTRYVTLGGAVANDVHGKNHHSAGTFGCGVRRIGLIRSDRGFVELAPDLEPELFAATIGGLGMTGAIAWVEIQLSAIASSDMLQEAVPFGDLDGFFDLAAESAGSFEHTAAWIDCTASGKAVGRGVFQRGNWAGDGPLVAQSGPPKKALPITPPISPLNPLTLKAFNTAYGALQGSKRGVRRAPYASALYPLDAVGGWNRFYGPAGFRQYQFVVPPAVAKMAVREALSQIVRAGEGSFLAVLKTFGAKVSPGLISFPMGGATLALDFPNRGRKTLDLFDRLDAVVDAAGGRLYPAKDGRIPTAMFHRGYERSRQWIEHHDPAMASGFWRRVTST